MIGKVPVFVPRTVLPEAEWLLRGVYSLPPERVIPALRAFAGFPGVMVEDAGLVAEVLDWAEAGLDFANALHLAAAAGCDGFVTFDERFACSGTRVSGLPVSVP